MRHAKKGRKLGRPSSHRKALLQNLAAALIQQNPDPSEADILGAVSNLCRCGVYPRLVRAIQRAGRVVRRMERISAAPAPGIDPADAARAVPALGTGASE